MKLILAPFIVLAQLMAQQAVTLHAPAPAAVTSVT